MGRMWSRVVVWLGLRPHELFGLVLVFLGVTSIGIGIAFSVWFALRSFSFGSLTVTGSDLVFFLLLFGLGGVVTMMGIVELRRALPLGEARKEIEAEMFFRKRKARKKR